MMSIKEDIEKKIIYTPHTQWAMPEHVQGISNTTYASQPSYGGLIIPSITNINLDSWHWCYRLLYMISSQVDGETIYFKIEFRDQNNNVLASTAEFTNGNNWTTFDTGVCLLPDSVRNELVSDNTIRTVPEWKVSSGTSSGMISSYTTALFGPGVVQD